MAYGLHHERTGSLHCYEDGTWYCYGCRAGGSVFDFAGRLWGIPTRGPRFIALRSRLAEELFGVASPARLARSRNLP